MKPSFWFALTLTWHIWLLHDKNCERTTPRYLSWVTDLSRTPHSSYALCCDPSCSSCISTTCRPRSTEARCRLFADDSLLYRVIYSTLDQGQLQQSKAHFSRFLRSCCSCPSTRSRMSVKLCPPNAWHSRHGW